MDMYSLVSIIGGLAFFLFGIQKTEALVKQIKKLKKSDLKTLRKGKTSAESSVYISEYLSVCRRIAEHSQNIAESLL